LRLTKQKKKHFLETIKASKQLISKLALKDLLLDGELTEFDTESYSSVQRIWAYLLTDTFLITTLPLNGKCSILHMFDLSDLAIVNVRDGQGVKHAFKILYALDSRMFSAPEKESKLAWLDQIERAKKNYRKGVQIDAQKLEEIRLQHSDDVEEETASEGDVVTENNSDKETDEIQQEEEEESENAANNKYPDLLNVDWLIELPEDLDMCIAQRDFEGAVNLVEKGRSYLVDFPESSSLKDIRGRIENRVEVLVATLEKALDNSTSIRHVSLRSIRIYVFLLIRLGRSKLACELFLQNRSYEIKNSFKQLKMEGATQIYIQKLVNVFFTALIETGKEYKKNFPFNKNCSSFIVWLHNELQHFANKFSHQVFTRNSQLSDISTCIKTSLEGCERLFNIGIDLSFDLQHMFIKDLMSAMFDTRDQLLEKSKLKAMEDTWQTTVISELPDEMSTLHDDIKSLGVKDFDTYIDNNEIKLSLSTLLFSRSILLFVRDGVHLYTPELHDVFVQCLFEIFKAQAIQFESLLKDKKLKKKFPFILSNAEFVYERVYRVIDLSLKQLIGNDVELLKPIKNEEMKKLRKLVN